MLNKERWGAIVYLVKTLVSACPYPIFVHLCAFVILLDVHLDERGSIIHHNPIQQESYKDRKLDNVVTHNWHPKYLLRWLTIGGLYSAIGQRISAIYLLSVYSMLTNEHSF